MRKNCAEPGEHLIAVGISCRSFVRDAKSASQILEEKLRDPPEQMKAGGRVADAVAPAGIDQDFSVAAGLDKLLGEFDGVGEVHVVVAGAGSDQKFALELGDMGDGRGSFVALSIVLR